MNLDLVPIESENFPVEEKKQWNEQRNHPIPPEVLLQFNPVERKSIKRFLVRLIVLTEQFDHLLSLRSAAVVEKREYYTQEMEKINQRRKTLFQNPPLYLENFIKLLELCPMEHWHEFDAMLKSIQEKEMQHYRDTKLSTGISAALDNPFLLRMEDEIDETHLELTKKCRITPNEIESLVMNAALEDVVRLIVEARRVKTGAIWDRGFYDL